MNYFCISFSHLPAKQTCNKHCIIVCILQRNVENIKWKNIPHLFIVHPFDVLQWFQLFFYYCFGTQDLLSHLGPNLTCLQELISWRRTLNNSFVLRWIYFLVSHLELAQIHWFLIESGNKTFTFVFWSLCSSKVVV